MLATHLPFGYFSGFGLQPSAFSTCLLAQTPPLSTDEWYHGLAAILIILVILVAVSTIYKNLRPEPSLEKQTDSKISAATDALERRIDRKLDDLKEQIKEQDTAIAVLQRTTETGFKDLNRALGKLEGIMEAKAA